MKHLTYDINTKWNLLYKSYKRSGKRNKMLHREKLVELLEYNAMMVKFNHEGGNL